jgi:Kef-type K+ transport system membrane component KefB
MTGIAEIFVGLLLTVAVLALVARKLTIPYPILFVIGGLLIGLIPKLPKVRLEPELVFLFFLPPLLFPAALFTSWRDFRANLRPISLLAIGLVLFTTTAVAYLAHYFMGLPLAAGFVLGAIISPPTPSPPPRLLTASKFRAASSRFWKAKVSSTMRPRWLLIVSPLSPWPQVPFLWHWPAGNSSS